MTLNPFSRPDGCLISLFLECVVVYNDLLHSATAVRTQWRFEFRRERKTGSGDGRVTRRSDERGKIVRQTVRQIQPMGAGTAGWLVYQLTGPRYFKDFPDNNISEGIEFERCQKRDCKNLENPAALTDDIAREQWYGCKRVIVDRALTSIRSLHEPQLLHNDRPVHAEASELEPATQRSKSKSVRPDRRASGPARDAQHAGHVRQDIGVAPRQLRPHRQRRLDWVAQQGDNHLCGPNHRNNEEGGAASNFAAATSLAAAANADASSFSNLGDRFHENFGREHDARWELQCDCRPRVARDWLQDALLLQG